MNKFRLIVAGGRDFDDYHLMVSKLSTLLVSKQQTHEVIVVSGTARGADKLGEKFARQIGLGLAQYPADWDTHGKSAGYKRNSLMADNADACVVFWDGKSKGTKHMIDLAERKGLPLRVVHY